VSLTFFLASLLTFLGSLGGTYRPSTRSVGGFQSDAWTELGLGAEPFLLLLLPLEVGRDGSLGAHDRPIDATASAIVDLSPRRTQLLSTSAVWVRAYARAVAAEVRRERGEQGERKAAIWYGV
jgi:hypothetical protein